MKSFKKFFAIILAACLMLFCFAACAPENEDPNKKDPVKPDEKTVSSLTVSKMPNKVEYYVGDEFSAEGGEISVKYSDNTTEVKKMTDEGVTVSEVKTQINDPTKDSQKKSVTVTYGGKETDFEITVSYQKHTVTFDYNYTGAESATTTVRHGEKVEKPDPDPTRTDFQFEGWFADAAGATEFDFDNKAITEDTTIYAKWLDVSKKYYKATFDYNYTRSPKAVVQTVEENGKVVRPAEDPTREYYAFKGWFIDPTGTAEYNFDSELKDNVTIYAKWERTLSMDQHTFTFEAENINLKGITGKGISGTVSDKGLVQSTAKASEGRCLGYQYELGITFTFQLVSDMDVEDATIVLRLSAEYRDIELDSGTYIIEWNGTPLDYNPIIIDGVPKGNTEDVGELNCKDFADFTIITNAKIKKGLNTLSLQTNNEVNVEGTTMMAMAPIIDCLKITTTAALSWDATLGLPMENK